MTAMLMPQRILSRRVLEYGRDLVQNGSLFERE